MCSSCCIPTGGHFWLLEAPHILQSDNVAEFTASVVTELKQMWADLLIVHGKPRHPQNQGSVERFTSDVKNMLIAWMNDNNSTDWLLGLKFVRFSKNTNLTLPSNKHPTGHYSGASRSV